MNYNYYKFTSILLGLFLIFPVNSSFAETEPILITFSDSMQKLIIDGKWTFKEEWKSSSATLNGLLNIRSAHYENFIYIFVDVLNDSTLDIGSDRTVICFDTNNDKSLYPDMNDYCFIGVLGRDTGFTLQGGSSYASKSYFQLNQNHEELIIVGGISDENDRYSKQPHPSYEFKIPTDLISRSNHYGFYVESFDAKSGKSYTWPTNIDKKSPTHIPTPEFWGELISIDKSLPEFPLPLLIFSILIMSLIIMSKKLNGRRLTINNL